MVSKLIVISGTPGVGKSTLAVKLAKKLGFNRLDLHDYYEEISVGYNKKKMCYDVDIKKLKKLVKSKGDLVFDSHIAHLIPADVCIVLVCSNLKKLERRLVDRKYSKKKVRENLDAEIFQVCLLEAQERHKVIVVDVAKRWSFAELVKDVQAILR